MPAYTRAGYGWFCRAILWRGQRMPVFGGLPLNHAVRTTSMDTCPSRMIQRIAPGGTEGPIYDGRDAHRPRGTARRAPHCAYGPFVYGAVPAGPFHPPVAVGFCRLPARVARPAVPLVECGPGQPFHACAAWLTPRPRSLPRRPVSSTVWYGARPAHGTRPAGWPPKSCHSRRSCGRCGPAARVRGRSRIYSAA